MYAASWSGSIRCMGRVRGKVVVVVTGRAEIVVDGGQIAHGGAKAYSDAVRQAQTK
jgi:hypothetical protein